MADVNLSNRDSAVPPTINEYTNKFGVAPQYLVTLKVDGDDTLSKDNSSFYVTTSLDETFGLAMRSQWDAPFANAMGDAVNSGMSKLGPRGQALGGLVLGAAKGAGIEAKNRFQTAQMWQSTDPIGFNIPFTFIAVKDAKTEVADKVRNLLKLVAPSQFAGILLRAPGPTVIGQLGNALNLKGRRITLMIGTFLLLENCIVKGVDVQFDSILDEKGTPLKAKVTVDIESYYTCFTTQDLDALFQTGG